MDQKNTQNNQSAPQNNKSQDKSRNNKDGKCAICMNAPQKNGNKNSNDVKKYDI